MTRRDPKEIAAQKRAERQDTKAGAGFEGKLKIGFKSVVDPYDYRGEGIEITVAFNERESSLDRIRKLTADQRRAGEIFRANYEASGHGRGLGLDMTRERVDTSGFQQTEQARYAQAIDFLNNVVPALGLTGYALVVKICGEGQSISEATAAFGWGGSKRAELYTGKRLREALSDLAVHLGLRSK